MTAENCYKRLENWKVQLSKATLEFERNQLKKAIANMEEHIRIGKKFQKKIDQPIVPKKVEKDGKKPKG